MRAQFLAALMLLAVPAGAENGVTAAEKSHLKAKAIFDAAVEAHGGEAALRAIKNAKIETVGELTPRLQQPTAAPPYEKAWLKETLVLDLEKNRMSLETKNKGGGFAGHNRLVLVNGEGKQVNLLGRMYTPVPAANVTQQQFVQYQRRLPNLILRTVLDRALTLRYLGEDNFEGKKQNVITFVHQDGLQMALYFDAVTNLLSKYELLYNDNITGTEASEIIFLQPYKTIDGVKVPGGFEQRLAGENSSVLKYNVAFNQPLDDSAFTVATEGYAALPVNPTPPPATVEKLADGVYLVQSATNAHTLAVEFADYIVAVEGPTSSASADGVIEKIKQTIPNKPIKYVVATHHHGDHIGGLRSFVAEGAEIVTTAGPKGVIQQLVAAKQTDRLGKSPVPAKFMLVEKGKHIFADGNQKLVLIDVGPHPHAKEMLVAYLPKQKLVFQGDLFFAGYDKNVPLGPPQESTLVFAKKMKEMNLEVDWVAGVHGRVVTRAEFDEAVKEPVVSVAGND